MSYPEEDWKEVDRAASEYVKKFHKMDPGFGYGWNITPKQYAAKLRKAIETGKELKRPDKKKKGIIY